MTSTTATSKRSCSASSCFRIEKFWSLRLDLLLHVLPVLCRKDASSEVDAALPPNNITPRPTHVSVSNPCLCTPVLPSEARRRLRPAPSRAFTCHWTRPVRRNAHSRHRLPNQISLKWRTTFQEMEHSEVGLLVGFQRNVPDSCALT